MMWRTFGFFLLLTYCEMIESGNVSLVWFDGFCNRSEYDLSKSAGLLENMFLLKHACAVESSNIEGIFKDKSVDIFIGTMNIENDRKYKSLAEYFRRSYITPYGADKRQDGDQIWSIGANYQRIAIALGVVLTHFKWRNIFIVTEEMSSYVPFGNKIFIELAHDGFRPKITYVKSDSTDDDIEDMLAEITDQHKGIVLLTHTRLRERIIVLASRKNNFAEKHSIFLLETNPYITPNIEYFNSTCFSNVSSDILHSIFYLHPSFGTPEGHLSKRSAQTRTESLSKQLVTGKFQSVPNGNESEINFIYDAIMAIDKLISDTNGSELETLFHLLSNRTFLLHSGQIRTDSINNVLYDFVLTELDVEEWEVERVQEIKQRYDTSWEIFGLKMVQWPNDMVLGPDECFHVESCRQESHGMDALYILAIAIAVLFVAGIATAVIITVWRKIIHRDMSKGQHKVLLTQDDLVFLSKRDVQKGSKLINGNSNLIERPDLIKDSSCRGATNRSMVSLHEYADVTETARYNGDLVHVKELKIKNFEIKSKVLQVIKTIRDIRHENVNLFVGFYDNQQTPAIITDFCSRGSLEDVLHNQDIKLDWDFKVSLLTDLIRGVRYIHNSSLRWHGNLKCRNCLIDSRWVLKVADFGLPILYGAMKYTPKFNDTDILCMAPEHLRDPVPGLKGSEKGDVYSISIIMQCVVLRSDPYSTSGLTPSEIIQKLKHPPPLLRPSVSHGTAPPQYIQLMKVCWTENPEMRPGMEEIYQQFKTFTGGKKMNIVDTMFRMLEKYSTDLEDLVKDRTLQLEEEKKKTELLLYRMLPRVVADSLKCGRNVEAEQFSEVTIYFSDIVGFTTISANSTPMQVVDLLNDLYTMFDATIDAYDVYKVETIGDAYMVCSGLPVRNGNRHAGEISTMALDLLSQCGNFTIKHMPEVPLRVRIGLHSGPAVAGVVGLTMPRYCLFGDTVNTASRMESTGAAYRIHISEAVKQILESLGGYQTDYRGEVELKGKGMAKTYWLIGKDNFKKELPDPPPIMNGDNHGLSIEEFKGGPIKRTVAGKQSRRVSSTTSPMFRSNTPVTIANSDTSKVMEQSLKNSVINVTPKRDSRKSSNSNLNDCLNVNEHENQSRKNSCDSATNCVNTNANLIVNNVENQSTGKQNVNTQECSPSNVKIEENYKMPPIAESSNNTEQSHVHSQFVFIDHMQNNEDENILNRCNNNESTRKCDSGSIKPDNKNVCEKLSERDKNHYIDIERHVTFRKKLTSEEIIDASNEDNNHITNHKCDIHGNRVNSPKKKINETKTRKTSTPTRTPSGKSNLKNQRLNETEIMSKRRRSSYQESLV